MSSEVVDESSEETAEEGLFDIDPKWLDTIFYGFLLGMGIYWMVTAFNQWERLTDKAFPIVLGIPFVLMILIHLARIHKPETMDRVYDRLTPATSDEELAASEKTKSIQDRLKEAQNKGSGGRRRKERERYEILMVGWTLALGLLMYFVGFLVGIPLWVFAFVGYFKGFRSAIEATVLFIVVVFGLFFLVLDLRIWPGLLAPNFMRELAMLIPGL